MPLYTRSGNGEGGQVDEDEALVKHGSAFFSFCNGNNPLYYVYIVLVMFDLFKSVASKMSSEASHDSDKGSSSTVTVEHRGLRCDETPTPGKRKRKFDTPSSLEHETIHIAQSEDQKEIFRNQAEITRQRASVAQIEAADVLVKSYDTANEAVSNYCGDESSFYYKVLVKRRDDLEQKLAVMYNMPTSETTAGAAAHM